MTKKNPLWLILCLWVVVMFLTWLFVVRHVLTEAAKAVAEKNQQVIQRLVLNLKVPIDFGDGSLTSWRNIENIIEQTSVKQINLRWYGYGGVSSYGTEFYTMMRDQQIKGKKFSVDIIAESASMHGFVICLADSYKIRPGAYVLMHAPRMFGPDNKPIYVNDPGGLEEQLSLFKPCLDKGIISQDEYNSIVVDHKALTILPSGEHVIHEDSV